LFGLNELAARLPIALSALAGVMATWLFAWRCFDARRAWLAGAILITTPLYAIMAQVLTTDVLLTAAVTAASFAFFLHWSEGGRWCWIGYAAIALGVLAKGPVAALLPALAVLIFLWWEGSLGSLSTRFHLVAGTLLALAIAAPWFICMIARVPDFFSFYFIGEHIRRFLDTGYSHSEPLYYYAPVLAAGLIPWSLIVPFVRWSGDEPNPARRFCVIAAAATIMFFSLARSKLIPYILPALPPIAVLIADAIDRTIRAGDSASSPSRLAVFGPILGLLGAAALGTALFARQFRTPYVMAAQPALYMLGAVVIIGGAVSLAAFRLRGSTAGMIVVITTLIGALWAGSYGRIEAEPLRSYAILAEQVAQRAPSDATLVCYRRYVQALPFYTRRRVILVGAKTELTFGAEHAEDADKYFFEGKPALLKLWNSTGPVVVVLDERDLGSLANQLGPFTVIGSEWHKRAILKEPAGSHGGR
jgi:4-amino-4-deoxy-L-arabinose transferase-like glycosyltransferase